MALAEARSQTRLAQLGVDFDRFSARLSSAPVSDAIVCDHGRIIAGSASLPLLDHFATRSRVSLLTKGFAQNNFAAVVRRFAVDAAANVVDHAVVK